MTFIAVAGCKSKVHVHEDAMVMVQSVAKAEKYKFGSDTIALLLEGKNTSGQYTLTQDSFGQGFEVSKHSHSKNAEAFYVLEGKVQFIVDKKEYQLTEGMVIYIPPGSKHSLLALTDSKMLMIYSPSGFEKKLRKLERVED
jgi:quercetin dioxygenase-like cupin family protein